MDTMQFKNYRPELSVANPNFVISVVEKKWDGDYYIYSYGISENPLVEVDKTIQYTHYVRVYMLDKQGAILKVETFYENTY